MRGKIIALMLLFWSLCPEVFASGDDLQRQIDELKGEMREMSARYEQRIKYLEERLSARDNTEAHEGHQQHEHLHGKDGAHAEDPTGHKHHHGILGDKVSVIGALDARFVNVEKQKNTLMLHEAKIGAQAQITDWLFGYITVTKHHGEDVQIEEGYARIDIEEFDLSVKPGKFFVNFGPENLSHFFDRRTITLSAMHEGMFGHEPWADVGAQVDWKLPLDLYSKLSFSVLDGDNAVSFGDGQNEVSNNNLPVTANWTNAVDTEYGFFKLGNSFAYGQWDRDDKYNVYLAGGDAYYKLGNFDFQAEIMYRWKDLPDVSEENAYGYYLWGAYTIPFEYKYLKGLEILAGFGQFIPDTGDRETRITPQVSLVFNEFAKLRAAYEVRDQYPKDGKDNRFITQFALAF